ncbi:MAG: hypothetical protein JSW27_13720 [Phycisphaerales bacterium]|nr:MAG: hypothetical protein JSW27_13720 [Phycisphaerales bacterium]
MVSLVMLAIIAGCAVALYLKGTFIQGLTLVFNALLAGFVAFAFYEMMGGLLVKYAAGIALWAQMICFLLLFLLALAVLQTVTMQLGKEKTDLGEWPERVGRVVSGIILGYLTTGYLLTALALAPLPNNLPYARFPERSPDPTKPNKPMLSPDGFVTGLFETVSKGSFAAIGTPKSFAVLHADFLNQLYLNRHPVAQDVPLMTSAAALSIPTKAGVWEAPATLRDSDGQAVTARSGETLMLVRVGIKKRALKDAGKFTLSQLRLICAAKGSGADALAGQGQAVYPIGYIGSGGRLEKKSLTELITIQASQVPDTSQEIDFAFYVPTGLTPALIGFKGNNLEKVSAPVSGEDIPSPVFFGGSSPASENRGEPEARSRRPEGGSRSSSADEERRGSGLSPVGQALTGGALEEN